MNNNTRDDYKKAIRAKYEVEKEGEFSNYFLPTSQANLRNLCWLRFETNDSKDDLSIFYSVFDFDFDLSKSKYFATNTTDKFKPIVTFLKGEKELAHFSRVELAAILVDFNPRPFKKFNKEGIIEIDKPIEESYETLKNPDMPKVIFTSDEDDEVEKEVKNRDSGQREKLEQKSSWERENSEKEELTICDTSIRNEILKKEGFLKEILRPVKYNFFREILEKSKSAILGLLVVFGLIGGVIYFAVFKKHCMQWSNDHYEIVGCTSGLEDNVNVIIPYDENLLDFRKIQVCDTTTFFKSDGQAIIWYAKTSNGIDFFNTHGVHPENKKSLRGVTKYIIDKYVKGKSYKLTNKK